MSDEAKRFLSRWSRLKAEQRAASHAPPVPEAAEEANAEEVREVAVPETPREERPALPPVDSLTKDSDFTGYLDADVPEDLHRLALRKLWLSDPKLANLDGLNDYEADFRNTAKPVVQTAYRVGKGFADSIRQAKADMEAKTVAEADAEAPGEPPIPDRENG